MPGMINAAGRRTWPYLRTPPAIYLIVMAPICGLEIFLIATGCPAWMTISAGVVVFFSIVGFIRGYVRRLVLTDTGAELRRIGSTIRLPWSRVRRVGVYVPGGGVGGTDYFYVTAHTRPPRGKWEIDADTIQVQHRPGLMAAARHAAARHASAQNPQTSTSRIEFIDGPSTANAR